MHFLAFLIFHLTIAAVLIYTFMCGIGKTPAPWQMKYQFEITKNRTDYQTQWEGRVFIPGAPGEPDIWERKVFSDHAIFWYDCDTGALLDYWCGSQLENLTRVASRK